MAVIVKSLPAFVAFLCWFTQDQILKLVKLSKPFYSEFRKLDSEVCC